MYRCQICRGLSARGTAARRHVVRRADGSTEAELMLCEACHLALRDGDTLGEVIARRKSGTAAPAYVAGPPGDPADDILPKRGGLAAPKGDNGRGRSPPSRPAAPAVVVTASPIRFSKPVLGLGRLSADTGAGEAAPATSRAAKVAMSLRCDLCGVPVPEGVGQKTADTVLCEYHALKARKGD